MFDYLHSDEWIALERCVLTKAAVIVIAISLLGKVFGFARELLLANYFGTSNIVDVYLMSITIPSILFGFLPALGTGFTPIYYGIDEDRRKNQFLNNILVVSVAIAFICILITFIFKNQIVSFCAPGFDPFSKELTSLFLCISIWAVLFNTPVQILTAYLNCNGDYINSNVSNLFVSLIQAVFVVIAAKAGEIFLPIGAVLPWLFQMWWLGISSRKKGYRIVRYTIDDKYVNALFKLAAPLFISNILVDINGFIDKMLSSSLPEGRLSALNYSFTLRAVFVTAASTVITTIIYPKISEKLICGDKLSSNGIIAKYFDIISFIIVPVCCICIIFSEDLVRIILMRGNFDRNSLQNTVSPFLAYSISLIVIVWRELIIRIMYSTGRTSINLRYSLIEICINILLSLSLVRYFGHVGLAMATTIAAIITFPLYYLELKRILSCEMLKGRLEKILKIFLSTAALASVSFVTSMVLKKFPDIGFIADIVHLAISTCTGGIAYVIVSYFLQIEECIDVVDKIKIKLNRE